ncbi:hypothetical protein JKY79_02875, partial [Candidatus Babeliales bacterium]|nr:hypothetical protein [Candidatus Babeliales bacterium]
KIQQVKRHIKTVKKDLRVSFSRYLYGFDAQMKQVERIELSMRYSKANEQQVAEATVKQAVDNNVESQVSEGAV